VCGLIGLIRFDGPERDVCVSAGLGQTMWRRVDLNSPELEIRLGFTQETWNKL